MTDLHTPEPDDLWTVIVIGLYLGIPLGLALFAIVVIVMRITVGW